jgi:DNA (cytosine-5)-methyltransferase 1
MKYFDAFSGVGGFALGIQQAYDSLKLCQNVNTAKQGMNFTKTTSQNVKNVLENTNLSGEKETQKKAKQWGGNTTHCGDKESLKCTGESVPVAENLRSGSSHLNTYDRMDTRTEKNTEQDTDTNLHSKKTIKQNTKSCAITAIMQEGDMENVPICVGFSEIDKYATSIYEKHFPKHTNFGDITKIDETSLPDFDLFVGGFPCQSFSIAGKRGGFDDTRGTMFFEIARIVREKQPRLLLLENVKGLLSHDQGNTFRTVISTLDELGYDCQWQVLNSKNHGVPQNRERVFIIGHLRGTSRPEVFPLGGGTEKAKCKHADVKPMQWRRTEKGKRARAEAQKNGRDLTPFSGGHRELVPKDSHIIGTITSQAIAKDSLLSDKSRIRRLTPTECERLQGFPDGWTKDGVNGRGEMSGDKELDDLIKVFSGDLVAISDTQRYKTLGNAVTVNVIRAIVEKLVNK